MVMLRLIGALRLRTRGVTVSVGLDGRCIHLPLPPIRSHQALAKGEKDCGNKRVMSHRDL